MEKIEFKDLPDTTTPFTADTFNEMQDNIEEAIDLTNTYSSDEIIIGTWLGKPFYRKVINFGTLPNATTKIIQHNINNINYIVNIYGIAKRSNDNYFFPLNVVRPDNFVSGIGLYANSTDIQVVTGSDRTDMNAYVIIEYTKTTDVVEE